MTCTHKRAPGVRIEAVERPEDVGEGEDVPGVMGTRTRCSVDVVTVGEATGDTRIVEPGTKTVEVSVEDGRVMVEGKDPSDRETAVRALLCCTEVETTVIELVIV